MKRVWFLALLITTMACGAFGQAVDTTVCAVLKDPASFNGKTVRIKGTVVTGLDEFVVSDGDCSKEVNGIWLAYPQGAKAKSGPLAMIELQPAHNFAGSAPAARPAVTLTRDKMFKQFDSLLAQRHDQSGAICLGCPRYQVQATLVGRLDGVDDAGVQRDAKGNVTGLGGFGNLNAYPARLVLESVTDVTPKEIDYSTSDAILKKAKNSAKPESDQPDSDPVATAQKLVAGLAASPVATQIKADLALLPQGKKQGDVNIDYGEVDQVSANDGAQAAKDSSDGVLYNCTLNRDRLPGLALSLALTHLAQHANDVRSPIPDNERRPPLYILENNAWVVTATMAIGGRQKHLTLPGGFMIWDAGWSSSDMVPNMMTALNDFLTKEEMLSK